MINRKSACMFININKANYLGIFVVIIWRWRFIFLTPVRSVLYYMVTNDKENFHNHIIGNESEVTNRFSR